MTGLYTVTVDLYDQDGTTHLYSLDNARGIKWQDPINNAGWATFEVPLTDTSTTSITDRRIVKLRLYRDGTQIAVFGCQIRSETCDLAVDGRQWVRFENQPGLWALLGDARTFPEFGYVGEEEVVTGVNRTFSTLQPNSQRWFGFMSAHGGAWYITGDWTTPVAVDWDSGVHAKQPPDFKALDSSAKWIGAVSPNTTQTAKTINYFRASFTTSGAKDVLVSFSADDFLDLWIDGDPVFTADRAVHGQWKNLQQTTVRVSDGDHIVAARVANAPFVSGYVNAVGLIGAVHLINEAGDPGTLLLDTNASDWVVNDGSTTPGWLPANVAYRLFAEGAARGVPGVTVLNLGFDETNDSNGDPWAGERGQLTFDLGRDLSDIAATMSEKGGFDTDVDASTNTWHAYPRLGTDRTGSVTLALGDAGGALKAWSTKQDGVRNTSLIGQLADGSIVITDNDDAIAAYGRIEGWVDLGTVGDAKTAHEIMSGMLDEATAPLIAVTGEQSLLEGPIPYVDFFKGDTVLGPGNRNEGTVPVRVVSFTVDASGERVTVEPEWVVDRNA